MLFYESERSDQHNYLYCQRDHNFNFPAHLHHSFEFLCVQSGTLACTLETEQYEVHPGEALLVLPDQIQLYGVDADAMDYSLEPELASEASYLGDSQWRLTFPLPSDDLYYDGTLGLSFLDDQGVEENSFLIPVFLTT